MSKEVWHDKEMLKKANKYTKLALLSLSLALILNTASLITGINDLFVAGMFVVFPAFFLIGISEGMNQFDKTMRS